MKITGPANQDGGYLLWPLRGQADEGCCVGVQEDDAQGEGGFPLSDQRDGRVRPHVRRHCCRQQKRMHKHNPHLDNLLFYQPD